MSHNFITNSAANATLKKRLEKLISASQELKFLVGFFYFSGWQEIYKNLQDNPDVSLKILVGLSTRIKIIAPFYLASFAPSQR